MKGFSIATTKSHKRAFFVVVTVIIITALVWIELDTHLIGRWLASTIYDNRANFLSCDELPALSEVKSVMEQHNQVILEIKNINPENIEITIGLLSRKGKHRNLLPESLTFLKNG